MWGIREFPGGADFREIGEISPPEIGEFRGKKGGICPPGKPPKMAFFGICGTILGFSCKRNPRNPHHFSILLESPRPPNLQGCVRNSPEFPRISPARKFPRFRGISPFSPKFGEFRPGSLSGISPQFPPNSAPSPRPAHPMRTRTRVYIIYIYYF
jgi:hypothetical protein